VISSVGLEHYLDRVGVTGSNPVLLTIKNPLHKVWGIFYLGNSQTRLKKAQNKRDIRERSGKGIVDWVQEAPLWKDAVNPVLLTEISLVFYGAFLFILTCYR
jgi:hypothetical protein